MTKINGKLQDVLEMRLTELMSSERLGQEKAQRLLAEVIALDEIGDIIIEQAAHMAAAHPECMNSENFDPLPAEDPMDELCSLAESALLSSS
jgi:hypothetical protein